MAVRALIIAALVAATVSLFFVNRATLGVWVMALAIFLAAITRIAQAATHHSEATDILRKYLTEDSSTGTVRSDDAI